MVRRMKDIMKRIKGLFVRTFLDWETYENKINFLDCFYFQQQTRKENIKNIRGVGRHE